MYDTISLTIDLNDIGERASLDSLPKYLENTREIIKPKGDWAARSVHGKVENMSVSVYEDRATIIGSLSRYYLGDNCKIPTRGTIQRAIEKLGDSMHLPIDTARVTRLDVANNMQMERSVHSYFCKLGKLHHYFRQIARGETETLEYRNKVGTRQLVFYDKIEEMKHSKSQIPTIYKDSNLLRYELRCFKNREISAVLQRQHVTAADLYNEDVYISAIDLWRDNYSNISNTMTMEKEQLLEAFKKAKGKKELYDVGIMAILSLFGEDIVLEDVRASQKDGRRTRKEAKEYRDAIDRASKDFLCNDSDGLKAELDRKIQEAVLYYR